MIDKPLALYCGFDPREEAGYHAFCSSVIERSSIPVSFIPLHKPMLRSTAKDGTNAFTQTRFLIPYYQSYAGWAVFADAADMLCLTDIAELLPLVDVTKAVQVVKHDYKTKHPVKYVGTDMEAENTDYPRKNWASFMVIQCHHFAWRGLTPTTIGSRDMMDLLQLRFIKDDAIGDLPPVWNWLADEYGANDEAKILHYTAGSPAFPHYNRAPHAAAFRRQVKRMNWITP